MEMFVLICEAHSDDDRLLGIYHTVEDARQAYLDWEDRPYYPFLRIERRVIGAPASEYDESFVVVSGIDLEDHDI